MTASDRCLKTRGGRKMAEYQLKNQELTLKISSKGAEMKSLKDNKTNQEYLWHGDSAYWGRTSPVLFPIVGNYREKESVFEGKTYSMSQHGFARDMEFTLESQKEEEKTLSNMENMLGIYNFENVNIVARQGIRCQMAEDIHLKDVTITKENDSSTVVHFDDETVGEGFEAMISM